MGQGREAREARACNLLVLIIYLFFPSCYVALCVSKARHRLGRKSVSWCLETSLLKIPFPGRSSLPTSFVSFFVYFFLPVFEDNDLLFWVPDVFSQHSEVFFFFYGIYSALKRSFDEFVREKVVSPSYSCTILGPPRSFLKYMFIGIYFTLGRECRVIETFEQTIK